MKNVYINTPSVEEVKVTHKECHDAHHLMIKLQKDIEVAKNTIRTYHKQNPVTAS